MNRHPPVPSRPAAALSAVLASACLALAVGLPALVLYGLWTGAPPGPPIAPWQRMLSTAIGLLPVTFMAGALLQARQCLLGLRRGDVFAHNTVRHLRGLAQGALAAAVAGLLAPTLNALVLTATAPAGPHALIVRLDSQPLLMLVFAGIVWQIADVMTRAAELADEHAQIV